MKRNHDDEFGPFPARDALGQEVHVGDVLANVNNRHNAEAQVVYIDEYGGVDLCWLDPKKAKHQGNWAIKELNKSLWALYAPQAVAVSESPAEPLVAAATAPVAEEPIA